MTHRTKQGSAKDFFCTLMNVRRNQIFGRCLDESAQYIQTKCCTFLRLVRVKTEGRVIICN